MRARVSKRTRLAQCFSTMPRHDDEQNDSNWLRIAGN